MLQHNSFIRQSHPGLFSWLANTFLPIIFSLLYHQFAWTYDWVARVVSLGRWQSWIATALPYIVGPTVLEIGYGPGHLQVALQSMNVAVFGIDESWQMSRCANRRLQRLGMQPNLVRGIAQHLPFLNCSINQVVMTFPAEFLLNKATFSEIQRVLTPGGSVIILPFAWLTGRSPLVRLAAWLSRISGEAPIWEESYLEPLKQLGFEVSWEMIEVNSSRVLLIKLVNSVTHPLIPSETA